ncbi:MAG: hypothetical protein KGH71_06620, partial [Candidatus Micrarchaeota archaeon]|nr:hypothetical protein [Candidatus Micrarchaeota archaeon]
KLLKEYKLQLEMLGIPCFISKNHVNVTSLWKIKKFMGLIGSSNLKNIIKFEEYNRNKISLKNYDAAKLFSKYENIRLPYKMGL